jgi:hypothetical protein
MASRPTLLTCPSPTPRQAPPSCPGSVSWFLARDRRGHGSLPPFGSGGSLWGAASVRTNDSVDGVRIEAGVAAQSTSVTPHVEVQV